MSRFGLRKDLHNNRELYADHGFLHHEIARRMIDYLPEDERPNTILNDGVVDAYFTNALKERFPEAVVTEQKWGEHHLNGENARGRFDLIVSNLYLHDLEEMEEKIRSYQALLNRDGRLFFTLIGIGSFPNMRHKGGVRINGFPDIEDLGNFMHGLGFQNSVLFIEKINLTYERLETLFRDARVVAGRPFKPFKGLRTPRWYERVKEQLLSIHDGTHYVVSFDVLYADATVGVIQNRQGENEVFVDISQLSKELKG